MCKPIATEKIPTYSTEIVKSKSCDRRDDILTARTPRASSSCRNRMSHMTVSIKASIQEESPEFIFIELVELENQRADGIEQALLTCLTNAGFTEGKKSGAATRLTSRFPKLFVWHCMNHRLELAVSDAVDEVNSVNHFKTFIQKLYSLYSMSNKNERELINAAAAAEVGSQLLRIGRILDVRWVASSFRTVRAVWTSLGALVQHFKNACCDETRSTKDRQMYRGLLDRVQSPEFICDLGLMYDTLHELSLLSQELQSRSITLLRAEHLLKRSIRVIQSFKESPGEKDSEALEAKKTGVSVYNTENNGKAEFLQSLVNNLEKRLSFEDEIIKDLSILDQSKWPSKPSIRHGEEQIKRLCKRFNLCTDQALNGMRDLLEQPTSEPKDLKPLMNCMKTFPVSTAECERNFSLMNNISSDKRAVLLISNISNLMMININGPPTSKFDPRKYTRTWLKSHRAASSVSSRQCRTTTPLGESSHALHGILPASVGEPDDEPLNLSSEYVFLTPVVAPSTSTSIAPPDPPQDVCGPERRRRRRNAGAEDPYQKLLKMETEREVKQIELANEQIKLTLLQQKETELKIKVLEKQLTFDL
ncbi:E3 SUMO-protein ligase KIAA1586 [Merluccius polli]|uniref:E3 SUMO-protein ligase KIAA1586 n=1 Tax=Merluccius polli TaxID=89951 RepID=A0AA47P0R0_MERPO|nr:E3 SUMO-protein ligase KIAA1586 [Merluccius polli]